MKVFRTPIKGLLVVEVDVHGDNRGWFVEAYTKSRFVCEGIDTEFVQDNHSYSSLRGTLRGIHFQKNPKAQAKLVRCTRGAIIDVAVDLRKGSDTYKQWYSIELSVENKKQLFIPRGFGHAFLTITDDAEVQYKVDEYYSKEHDRSIRYDDPEIGIDWGVSDPIVSEKDLNAPVLSDSDVGYSIKVLVTGVNGQLGYDVVRRLDLLGIESIGVDAQDFDIVDRAQTRGYILRAKPDVVVHCAAYTAVDEAEDNRTECYAANVDGTRNIAEACRAVGAKLVYVSTDYVFDGRGTAPHLEDDPTSPINYYGYCKEQAEMIVRRLVDEHFIVRTSWLYGVNGHNFVKTMLRSAESRSEINVVSDQIGSPTYSLDLAVLLCDMLQTTRYGTYHGANEGYCSWYEFAVEIFRRAGISVSVNPILTSEYPTRARRPRNSRLSKEKLDERGFNRLPPWTDGLSRFLAELSS